MRLSYRFPALVRGIPPRCSNVRNAIVWMDGRVDVPELTSEDIPVACEVASARGCDQFRYFEGRFYSSCDLASDVLSGFASFERSTWLSRMMVHDITERWYSPAALLKEPIWPIGERALVEENAHNLRSGRFIDSNDYMLPTSKHLLPDLRNPYGEDVEHCERIARSHAEAVVCIEGRLWRPVAEPMLFLSSRDRGHVMSLRDMTFMRSPTRSSCFQPAPYGGDHYRAGYAGNEKIDYWDWKALAMPLNEHFQDIACDGGCDFDHIEVIMPEVFGHDFMELELLRVAKGICANVRTAFMDATDYIRILGPWKADAPRALKRVYGALSKATIADAWSFDCTEVELALERLSDFVKDNGTALSSLVNDQDIGILDVAPLIESLLDRFADRSICMPAVKPIEGFCPSA